MKEKHIYVSIIAILLCSLIVYLLFNKGCTEKPEETTELVIVYDQFNINTDTYYAISNTIKSGQTVGAILNKEGISYTIIDEIDRLCKPKFELKSIKAGNTYHLYYTNDTVNEFSYFIYEISPSKYLFTSFMDSLIVDIVEKEVVTKLAKGKGTITSSMWNAMKDNNLDPFLANKLAEVFAWEIDFYRIQKNDAFKLIYEKHFVDNAAIGLGRIKAALFEHNNKTFHAFLFENDSITAYYNYHAESLRKAFLKAPLKYSRITSGFSHNRLHPVLKTNRPHYGTDYAAPTGTPILAVGDGVVTEARFHRGNGNYVKIKHNSVYDTQYLHMSKFAKGIKPGVRVSQGDVIGYVGMTGLATGPHVCFRFWKNGKQVDHLKEEFPHAEPLDSIYHESFFKQRDYFLSILEDI